MLILTQVSGIGRYHFSWRDNYRILWEDVGKGEDIKRQTDHLGCNSFFESDEAIGTSLGRKGAQKGRRRVDVG